jgi:cyanophycinase
MSPARVKEGRKRGYIVAIGGAEKKVADGEEEILGRFTELSGGRDGRLAVIPTASEAPDTGQRYETIFRAIGMGDVIVLPFDTRTECKDAGSLRALEQATGVFMTGGNQIRLSSTLGGTPVAKLMRTLNASGIPVGGTSAGAAFLSEHMIATGDEGATPRNGMVSLAPGLGLTNRLIVDQHFRQRDRLGRLLTALSFNPFAIGLGLDEDAAAFIGPDETLEVAGSGGITIVDPAQIEHSSIDAARRGDPVCLIGIRIHVLIHGATFNLHTRVAAPPQVSETSR